MLSGRAAANGNHSTSTFRVAPGSRHKNVTRLSAGLSLAGSISGAPCCSISRQNAATASVFPAATSFFRLEMRGLNDRSCGPPGGTRAPSGTIFSSVIAKLDAGFAADRSTIR